ncbi:MAG TPA: glycoside hydrolase family 125 protein, partial [Sphingomonas sp.]
MENGPNSISRRDLLGMATLSGLALAGHAAIGDAAAQANPLANGRPVPAARRFTSRSVEAAIDRVRQKLDRPGEPRRLAEMFARCYPNTLDTTVNPGEIGGRPDTFVITGDIPAMWLRDSAAQVTPY